jgi:hypothetical protein
MINNENNTINENSNNQESGRGIKTKSNNILGKYKELRELALALGYSSLAEALRAGKHDDLFKTTHH